MIDWIPKLKNLITVVFSFLAAGVAVIGLLVAVPKENAPQLLIVRSGSMVPAIPVGSLVVTRPTAEYRVGDVISYRLQQRLITHRIVKVENGIIRARGDANNAVDAVAITKNMVAGKVWFHVPGIGAAIAYTRTPLGYAIAILLPSLLIIIQECLVIYRELTKKDKPKKKDDDRSNDHGQKIPTSSFLIRDIVSPQEARRLQMAPVAVVISPPVRLTVNARLATQALAVVVLVATAFVSTAAYFSDNGVSSGNVFTTNFVITPPLSTGQLVINEVLYNTSCAIPAHRQWVEIWNGGEAAIDLDGWKLRETVGGRSFRVQNHPVLQPGQLAVISHSAAYSGTCYWQPPANTLVIDWGNNMGLSSTNGVVELLNPVEEVVDHVAYGSVGQPSSPVDQSIERVTVGLDTAAGTNFSAADFMTRFPSTVGFILPATQDVVINEFRINPDHVEFVEVFNRSDHAVNIGGWTLQNWTENVKKTIPTGTILAPGARKNFAFLQTWLNAGDKIYLKNSSGKIMDAFNIQLFVPPSGSSWVRVPDGSDSWHMDATPTPNAANTL